MDERIAKVLASIENPNLDEKVLHAHNMKPSNVVGVTSDQGLSGDELFRLRSAPSTALFDDIAHGALHFDSEAFIRALKSALAHSTAGYIMQLRYAGNTMYTVTSGWAQTPDDSSERWTPNVRMHVASCSKLITGIAMTKLLNVKQIPYDMSIINYLPTYWGKGKNVAKVT